MRRFALGFVLGCLFLLQAAGCMGSDAGTGGGGGGTDSTPLCLSELSLGEACSPEGHHCDYDGGGCTISEVCVDGTWAFDSTSCVTECGAGEAGGFCAVVDDGCVSGTGCGARQWHCNSDHTWWVHNVGC